MSAYSIHLLRHLRFTIGQNIHALRTKRCMSLQKLSGLSGISVVTLDAYELGKYEIGLREILQIACALEADVRDVVKQPL